MPVTAKYWYALIDAW